jgi:predicted ribosome quality control (RQC) complex YloA/Tae2 family protein
MENFYLNAVARDLGARLVGSTVGRVWQPSDTLLVVDPRLPDGRYLLVSADPTDPALFLTASGHRELEEGRSAQPAFAALVRKRLGGARIVAVEKPADERVVTLRCEVYDASGGRAGVTLVAELTGRSANAYVVDAGGEVLGALRQSRGQRANLPGSTYQAPDPDRRPGLLDMKPAEAAALGDSAAAVAKALAGLGPTLARELDARARSSDVAAAVASLQADLSAPPSSALLYELSGPKVPDLVLALFPLVFAEGCPAQEYQDPHAAADARATRKAALAAFASARGALAARARTELGRRERVLASLEADLQSTEGAERLRQLGELLLAQIGTAKRVDGGLRIVDYYAEPPGEVVVEVDRSGTPQGAASRLFARYQRARRTREQAGARRERVAAEVEALAPLVARVEEAASDEALAAVAHELEALVGAPPSSPRGRRGARGVAVPGARRFLSSDGFEILVGRGSAANDALTFKVARPSDLWLHAADYPGSHVVVRNPTRAELPHRTLVEAARLAAFYSKAGQDTLVDVRYTQRKFVSKPRGAAPGLVRLSQFKTIAVTPSAALARAE